MDVLHGVIASSQGKEIALHRTKEEGSLQLCVQSCVPSVSSHAAGGRGGMLKPSRGLYQHLRLPMCVKSFV